MWGFRTGPWGKQGAQTTATSPLRAVCGDVPHSQHCPSAGYRARMGLEWRGWAEAGSLRTPSLFPWIAGQSRCLGVRSDSWLPREVTVSVCVVGAPTGPGPGAGLRPSALYLAPSRSLWLYAAPPPRPHPAPSTKRQVRGSEFTPIMLLFLFPEAGGCRLSARGSPRHSEEPEPGVANLRPQFSPSVWRFQPPPSLGGLIHGGGLSGFPTGQRDGTWGKHEEEAGAWFSPLSA